MADKNTTIETLYSNTISFTMQIRTALWSVILGGVTGGIIGSVARSLQGSGGAVSFSGPHANSAVGAILLAAILSGAAVVFSARKSDTLSFVTVKDFGVGSWSDSHRLLGNGRLREDNGHST